VQVVFTVTSRPDGSLNVCTEDVFRSLSFVIVVGLVLAVAFVLVITASVHVIELPFQPGDVLTLYPP
jgi:hypothetical protein